MKRLIFVALLLSSCTERDREIQRERQANEDRGAAIEAEIKQHGFAVVGTTPDGRKLYMKEINVGYATDRVYFTDLSKVSTVAREYCGKACVHSVATVQ